MKGGGGAEVETRCSEQKAVRRSRMESGVRKIKGLQKEGKKEKSKRERGEEQEERRRSREGGGGGGGG